MPGSGYGRVVTLEVSFKGKHKAVQAGLLPVETLVPLLPLSLRNVLVL